MSDEACGALTSEGYVCTLAKGHDGWHAHSFTKPAPPDATTTTAQERWLGSVWAFLHMLKQRVGPLDDDDRSEAERLWHGTDRLFSSRPSSEPGDRAALIDVCRILRSEGNEVDKADAAYQRAQEALASAPASSPGSGEEEGLRARVEALVATWSRVAEGGLTPMDGHRMLDDLRTALAGRADAGTNGGK